jgi:hypothetical protein
MELKELQEGLIARFGAVWSTQNIQEKIKEERKMDKKIIGRYIDKEKNLVVGIFDQNLTFDEFKQKYPASEPFYSTDMAEDEDYNESEKELEV